MRNHIRAQDTQNLPILDVENPLAPLIYFNLLTLEPRQKAQLSLPEHETVCAVLSGTTEITVDGTEFGAVGQRADIWSGQADSVYAPAGAVIDFTGVKERTEVAIAGGRCDVKYAPFRILPEDVDMVDVGSSDTKSHRRIYHILGQNGHGRAGNLLVSELYCEEGCWSGYPPHKHDAARDGETAHQELYHYRFNPDTGFGAQFSWSDQHGRQAVVTQNRDTFVVDRGYHPTVTSPGHESYIFTILVGRDQRSLVQYFDDRHAHLIDKIPGIGAMRDKFK